MSDNSFYFSHDYSASMDIKVEAMIGDFGAAGYGLFWTIVEMLHSESEHKLPLKKLTYMAISKRMSTPVEDVENFVQKCINDYELFVADDEYFYSKRVFTNISKRNEIREKRSESGKLGGRPKSKIKQTESICLANESKIKQRKEKEIKENKEVLSNNINTLLPLNDFPKKDEWFENYDVYVDDVKKAFDKYYHNESKRQLIEARYENIDFGKSLHAMFTDYWITNDAWVKKKKDYRKGVKKINWDLTITNSFKQPFNRLFLSKEEREERNK